MIKLAYDCAKIGLSGFEFMGVIPGNIGGGIFMNAGAYKSCLSEVVKSVKVLDECLKVVELSKDEMDFSYRHSIIQDHAKWIVLEATFVLENYRLFFLLFCSLKREETDLFAILA